MTVVPRGGCGSRPFLTVQKGVRIVGGEETGKVDQVVATGEMLLGGQDSSSSTSEMKSPESVWKSGPHTPGFLAACAWAWAVPMGSMQQTCESCGRTEFMGPLVPMDEPFQLLGTAVSWHSVVRAVSSFSHRSLRDAVLSEVCGSAVH